jgi:predicted ATPase
VSVGSRAAAGVRAWPLIGRDPELKRIEHERVAGASGVVVLAGAGVGKSHLARAALLRAEQRGAVTVSVKATRGAASVPLGAFAGVIPVEVRSDDLFELLRGSAAAIREVAGARPLVVGVDDAQLLDPTSAALVLHLANTGGSFVLATVRTGEPCPDAIVSLWKDSRALRLELSPLGRRESDEMVEDIVGGLVEEGVRRWLWETCRGNALYVRELVLGALDSGALNEVSGLWRMASRPPLSSSLTELISARLTALAGPERRLLELLALGEPLSLSSLFELAGRDPLVAAEERGLVEIEGPPAASRRGSHTRSTARRSAPRSRPCGRARTGSLWLILSRLSAG